MLIGGASDECRRYVVGDAGPALVNDSSAAATQRDCVLIDCRMSDLPGLR